MCSENMYQSSGCLIHFIESHPSNIHKFSYYSLITVNELEFYIIRCNSP